MKTLRQWGTMLLLGFVARLPDRVLRSIAGFKSPLRYRLKPVGVFRQFSYIKVNAGCKPGVFIDTSGPIGTLAPVDSIAGFKSPLRYRLKPVGGKTDNQNKN